KEIDLSEVAETVIGRHAALAQSRGVELSCQTDGKTPILGNLTGIEQVFTNLVKNAINYTPKNEGGQVSVTVRDNGDEVTASVADTGIGIAKRDLYYIFQPFYRADTSRVRGVGGGSSGLGLAIVNEIVRGHNGKIFVRSTLGRGTTIEITFPKMVQEEEANEEDTGDTDTSEYTVA
ncbi:MAG TPA: HAMP domain-containing sensor histidine kinase, partial [Candidatus Paceibacterota bacterium]